MATQEWETSGNPDPEWILVEGQSLTLHQEGVRCWVKIWLSPENKQRHGRPKGCLNRPKAVKELEIDKGSSAKKKKEIRPR